MSKSKKNREKNQDVHKKEILPMTGTKTESPLILLDSEPITAEVMESVERRVKRTKKKLTAEDRQILAEKKVQDKERILAMREDENFPYRRGNIVWYEAPEEVKGYIHTQSGLRRGLIFSNDVNNLFSDLIYIIPCSRKWKRMKLHVKHGQQFILAEQLNPVDKSWILLDREIEKIDEETLAQVELNFMKQFGLIDLEATVLPNDVGSVAQKD